MNAHATIQPAGDARQVHEQGHDCPCGCAPCEGGCGLECLERPRYFCGQLLTDSDLTALVKWTRARLALARHRDGWGVVCGLDVRCDPRKPSSVEIGEGYAVSCCGSDIVVCEPEVVDLSDACRPPESPCDDPCAPAPEDPRGAEADDREGRQPWDCPEGIWVELFIDAVDEEAGGRPTLTTDGCRRIGSCEASRVRESQRVFPRRAGAGDPLTRAEQRWLQRYDRCFAAFDDSGLPTDDVRYGDLRLAVERFALDHACEGGCRALRWICPPGAPSDETMINHDVVQHVRLALLLDCLTAVGSCDCQTCAPGTAVMLARVLLVPGRTEDCPCRVVAVDEAPPYRRPLGHDCPPAALGRVNLGDLLGQRPEAVCLEVKRRGVTVIDIRELDSRDPVSDIQALGAPIVDCDEPVIILTAPDECLGPRVVGFRRRRREQPWHDDRPYPQPELVREIPDPSESPLLYHSAITADDLPRLAERGITSLRNLGWGPSNAELGRLFPGESIEAVRKIRAEARRLASEAEE